MSTETLTLDQLRVGESFVVDRIRNEGAMKRRLEDLGIVSGTQIDCVMRSPLGDPWAYRIRGAVIALRSNDAATVVGFPIATDIRSAVWD